MSAGSYCYAAAAAGRSGPYSCTRSLIHEIAACSGSAYGSPRIWLALRSHGVFMSEKVVRRVVKEGCVEVRYARCERKRSSCIGELTPAVGNMVNGCFHASAPDELRFTDITEFSPSDAKAYLNPAVDCFDGMVVSWSTSRHPAVALVGDMLEQAVSTLDGVRRTRLKGRNSPERLVIHADRGGCCRGATWSERLEDSESSGQCPEKATVAITLHVRASSVGRKRRCITVENGTRRANSMLQ